MVWLQIASNGRTPLQWCGEFLAEPNYLCSFAGEAVGVSAGFDDGACEREPVDDGCAEAWVSEGFGPAGEGFVGAPHLL